MNFKGTKGTWKINHTLSHILETKIACGDIRIADVKHYNDEVSDDWKGDPTFEEGRANALLISKTPELLEMLNHLIEDEQLSNWSIIDAVRQLIKEATEF